MIFIQVPQALNHTRPKYQVYIRSYGHGVGPTGTNKHFFADSTTWDMEWPIYIEKK